MNYNYAFNAYDNNAQPDPSAAAYVPGAQQQYQLVDPTTGLPYQAWQQQQYFGPGALDFNVAPPPLPPAGVYGYQPQVSAYNGPVYTGDFIPQLPTAPVPAHQEYAALRAAYDNPMYPDAANFFAQQPPAPAYDGPVYPVGAQQQQHVVAPQHVLRYRADPEPEAEPQEVEPEPEPESEPEDEADEGDASDEEAQPPSQSHAPAAVLAQFYHGMSKAAADDLSARLHWKHDKKGRVECPVIGCKATYTRRFDAIRHVVDNTMVCPHCGRPLKRHDAYFIRRHEDTEVCKEARRAAAAAGQH